MPGARRAEDPGMQLRPFERWCLGRRSLGARPLTPAERAQLESLSRRAWLRVANPLLGFAAFWAVLVTLAPALLRGHAPGAVFPAALFLGILLGIPVTILLTTDILRRIGDARADLRADRVERFAPLDPASCVDGPALIDVRQPSGRLLTGPDHLVGHVMEVREVAPAPIVDFRVAQEAHGVPAGRKLERRDLSLEECEEMRRSIREMERVRPSRLLLLAWAVLCLGGMVGMGARLTPVDRLALGASLVIGLLVAARDIHGRQLARRMRADVANGFAWVLTSQTPDTPKEEEGLPRSRRTWTVAGRPAAWRGSALKGARRG